MATILVVDDERNIRSGLCIAFEDEGYDTAQAEDGEQAWSIIQKQGADLVVTDLRMPVMSGYELLKKIGDRLDTGAHRVVLHIPYDKGGIVDLLHREAKVERVDYGDAIEVEAVCTPVQLGRLKEYIVSGWTPPKEFWED